MIEILKAYGPAVLAVLLPVALATASAVIAKYNPNAGPPPWWLVPLIVVRNILSARAPEGTDGIAGTQWSIPLAHYPSRKPNGIQQPDRKSGTGAGALVPFLFLALFASSCTQTQTAAWKTAGIDAATCAGKGVLDAAGDALTELLAQAAGSAGQLDYAQMGLDLATKYGTAAALCAAGKAWVVLSPTIHGQPSRAALLVGWLIQHPKEWSAGRPKRSSAPPSPPLFYFYQTASATNYASECTVDEHGRVSGPRPELCVAWLEVLR